MILPNQSDLLENNVIPDNYKQARTLLLEANQYIMYNGILYNVWYIPRKGKMPEQDIVQVYIPETLVLFITVMTTYCQLIWDSIKLTAKWNKDTIENICTEI